MGNSRVGGPGASPGSKTGPFGELSKSRRFLRGPLGGRQGSKTSTFGELTNLLKVPPGGRQGSKTGPKLIWPFAVLCHLGAAGATARA